MGERLTSLDRVCFPVEQHRVFAILRDARGERRIAVDGKTAIINKETSRVLGVVGRDYRMVTNEQALEWAYLCCQAVFPATVSTEWTVSATDGPSTGSYCTIDLVHRSAGLDFSALRPGQRPEVYGPFIRVTNSYNSLRALAFDIGFHRKVCRNGLIAPDTVIRFAFAHRRRDLGQTIQFDVAHDRVERLHRKFADYLGAIRRCDIPRVAFEPILRGVLLLQPMRLSRERPQDKSDWQALEEYLGELSNRYARELGENGYAVLNAITDFASRPPENRHVHRDRHALQRLAGTWVSAFSEECQRPDFSVAAYLAKLARNLISADRTRAAWK